jgi:glycosyltransferase involved in cell wall biosynthesis
MTEKFALHFVPGQYSAAAAGGVGGAELVRAIGQAKDLAQLGCFAAGADDAAECRRMLREAGYAGRVDWIGPTEPRRLEQFGCLYHPSAAIGRLAWRRLALGDRGYSLCGITHGVATHAAMSAIAGWLTAPVRSWDAVICTSRAVRDSVRLVLEAQAGYLRAQVGAQRFELPQLPVIAPGVHWRDRQYGAAQRATARRTLGIDAGDVAFLFLGPASGRAALNPQQMLGALERAPRQDRKLHLIACGAWTDAAAVEALREAAGALCPSVPLVLLDRSVPGDCDTAWAAADVFTSLADSIDDTCGPEVLQAMAAGLPSVVSDWNGYRDTVRDGVDGYRIPTLMPEPGAGSDLALRYDDGADSYDTYHEQMSQAVAVDGTLLAQAYSKLIGDAALREEMGTQARERAQREFDWSVILRRYRELWADLAERRRADPALQPLVPRETPDRLDPSRLFATHASAPLTRESMVELAPHASLALLREYRELQVNRPGSASQPTLEEFGRIFGAIGPRPMQVDELIDTLGPCDRPTLLRGLAWLCKMDLMRVVAQL